MCTLIIHFTCYFERPFYIALDLNIKKANLENYEVKKKLPIVDAYSSECVLAFVNKLTKKTPEGVYAGCVGVSKNYVEWY